ncbi:hypothetical protein L596_010612 [Steinernema carpocapsae]|uniref:Insulin-like domain-containing protein n=1 Tax=Steinernema carpocapsae TaxID=34508 RepID=A0A4V6A6Z4_STECR|nr:hypothetical protein L596_010612 [Steinernema carpocapsae]
MKTLTLLSFLLMCVCVLTYHEQLFGIRVMEGVEEIDPFDSSYKKFKYCSLAALTEKVHKVCKGPSVDKMDATDYTEAVTRCCFTGCSKRQIALLFCA